MQKSIRVVLVVFTAVVFGVLCALQVKTVRGTGGFAGQSASDSISGLQAEKTALQAELRQTNKLTEELTQQRDGTRGELDTLTVQYDTMRKQAGLTDLSAAGIIVTINPRSYNDNGRMVIVRAISDQELLLLVNELNAAGAKALSINGHRLISRSAIRLAGDFVNINNISTAMPYEVRALGNPESLETALRLYGGMFDQLSEFYDVTIQRKEKMSIPAYQGALLDGATAQ